MAGSVTATWLVRGDARRLPLADKSVQCVVTSPPYLGLRSYGGQVSVWGGDHACKHLLTNEDSRRLMTGGTGPASVKQVTNAGTQFGNAWVEHSGDPKGGSGTPNGRNGRGEEYARGMAKGATCTLCGAWKGELGSEPTPAMFVAHLVEVFAEVKRVLLDEGVCFLNIGDSYAGSGAQGTSGGHGPNAKAYRAKPGGKDNQGRVGGIIGSLPKSLLLVPERLAIALSDDGWIIRSRIAWCKAAPMPESTKDRPTSAWEHIWVLTKRGKYYWDQEAVREPASRANVGINPYRDDARVNQIGDERNDRRTAKGFARGSVVGLTRNLWNYWVIPPDPYPGSHFATFPRAIPERCIKAASREGDIVLDPFSGSGTTAYVAASLGRKGIGIDLSAEYIEQARTGRLAQEFLPL